MSRDRVRCASLVGASRVVLLEEMIPDLSGALLPEWLPARRQRRQRAARGALDINERARGEPQTLLEEPRRRRKDSRGKRRIEEYDVKELGLRAQIAQHVHARDAAAACAPLRQALAQIRGGGGGAVDEL